MIGVLLQLLPKGLYDTEPGTTVRNSLEGEAAALEELEGVTEVFVPEVYPDKTVQLLSQWEALYGLKPASSATISQRRAALMARVRAEPSLSRAFLASSAAEILGYTPAIRETYVLRVGAQPVGMVAQARIFPVTEMYRWHMDINPALTDIGTYDRRPLELLIEALQPAHTQAHVGFAHPFLVGINQVGKDHL